MKGAAAPTAFLCGLAGLLMQLSISRLIFFYVANSEHATALVVTAHLCGFLFGAALKRCWPGGPGATHAFTLILLLNILVMALAFIGAIQFIPAVISILLLMAALLLIAVMFGFIIAALVLDNSSTRGATDIVIADALGSVAGALLAGFFILPRYGIQASLWTGIAFTILGLLSCSETKNGRRNVMIALAVVIACAAIYLVSPLYSKLVRVSGLPLAYPAEGTTIIREAHTPFGQLSVIGRHLDHPEARGYGLFIDNRSLCNLTGSAENRKQSSEWLLGEKSIAALNAHGLPGQVAIVGLGCGITLGAVLEALPEEAKIDMVEINPGMPDMARLFNAWNGDVLADPRVKLITADGFRFFMERSAAPSYGAVIIDLAWMQNHNASHLFSQEFYQAVKRNMSDRGVIAIWTEERGPTQTLAVMYKTLQSVFSNVVVNGDRGYFILFASDDSALLAQSQLDGSHHETHWTRQMASGVEINRLDNLVLNRSKFTLFGTHDPSEINGPSIYRRMQPAENP